MKILSLAALALLPTLTLAAPKPAEKIDAFEHSKRFSHFTKWDEVIAEMKETLPPLVVKEFAAAAKDLPFPTIQLQKRTLIFTRNKDGKKTYLTLEADGQATLNGKPLTLEPLATPKDEMDRISLLTEKQARAQILDLLIAQAMAGDGDLGATAAVYSGANSWKAKSCGADKLSGGMEKDCLLMGVALKMIDNDQDKVPLYRKAWPVSLKCIQKNDGMMELLTQTSDGTNSRWQVMWKKGRPISAKVSAGSKSEPWFDIVDTNLETGKNLDDRAAAIDIINRMQRIKESVCDSSPPTKARYMALLDNNKKELIKSSPAPSVSATLIE